MEKSWQSSKLNWVGVALTLVGVMTDPEFVKLVGELIPPAMLSRFTALSGIVVMVLRTFYTNAKIGTSGNQS